MEYHIVISLSPSNSPPLSPLPPCPSRSFLTPLSPSPSLSLSLSVYVIASTSLGVCIMALSSPLRANLELAVARITIAHSHQVQFL